MDKEKCVNMSWLLVRITLGFTMLWGFFDKLLGLGFSTCRDKATDTVTYMCTNAWVSGGSPTFGFLKFGAKGPLGSFFGSLASASPFSIINILFMLGLLGIGISLLFGVGLRIAGYSGALMMIFMYLAAFTPENNPLIDDHLINAAVFLLIAHLPQIGENFGIGKWWKSQAIVKKYKCLE